MSACFVVRLRHKHETDANSQTRSPPELRHFGGRAGTKGLSVVLITNSKRMWIVGMAVSLTIFALLYLTVIKPSSDTANHAVKAGLQQTQQAITQAQKQLDGAAGQTAAAPSTSDQASTVASQVHQAGTAPGASEPANTVASQAQQQLSKAAKLTSCVAAAGTDLGQVQACQAKYHN